jgi:hypothetical protein
MLRQELKGGRRRRRFYRLTSERTRHWLRNGVAQFVRAIAMIAGVEHA